MSEKVTRWLEGLNLGEFAEVFVEQRIEFSDLYELNDVDLKELGVPLGPRKRLLRAISTLQAETQHIRGESDLLPTGDAERRQLTVMFCDLVGSTELSTQLDPEELREIITACHDSWKICIERYEGFIARYMGDGVLAYFGYPRAHEDDPERAIHSGLAILAYLPEVETKLSRPLKASLGVRIGIATGPVVVGDIVGEGASAESAAIGETPNLAARLQGIANPNGIVVAPGTHALTTGRFHFEDLGPHKLKGIDGKVTCWEVTGERIVESRFKATRPSALIELIGREEELAILRRRWERVKESEGQVVLISGEPGIGKSRLVEAIDKYLEDQPCDRFYCQCSPMHSESALYPVIKQIEGTAGILHADSPDRKHEKLIHLTQAAGMNDQTSSALSALLSIPVDPKFSDIEPDPEKRKSKTLDAIIELLEHQAANVPMIYIFEDIHWIDPSTMELLEELVERIASRPILILVTYRSEFNPPWAGLANATLIALSRMAIRESTEMISRITKGKALPDEIQEQIITKTDGIPLFVEELTQTVLESGLIEEQEDRYVLTGPLPPLAIPTTLQDSLTARLDRLSSVKHIAQLGAVLGRSFDYELIAAVAEISADELGNALSRLEASGLVLRRGTPPTATYAFKHALIRDSAYQSLLKGPRQNYHQRIAQGLEQEFPEIVENDPAILALHYTEAGLAEPAIRYWHRAGERAFGTSAYQESISNLHRALDLLKQLSEGPERNELEIPIQLVLGGSELQVMGQGSAEALATYTRAWQLCQEYGTPKQRFQAQWGLHFVNMMRGDLIESRDMGLGLVPLAEELDDADLLLEAHHVQWSTMFALGEIEACITHLDYVIPRYQQDQHHHLTFDFGGHDPGVCAFNIGSLAKWMQGFPEEAWQLSSQALELADSLGHPFSLFEAHLAAGYLHLWNRDSEAIASSAARILDFVESEELPRVCSDFFTSLHGAVLVEEGNTAAGLKVLSDSITSLTEAFGPWAFPSGSVYADALSQSGCIDEALDHIQNTLTSIEQGGTHWWDAEFYRVRGDILLRGSDELAPDAEAEFQRAFDCASSNNIKFLELRTAISLGRLLVRQGRTHDAQRTLAPVIDSFAQNGSMVDLQNARALLETLSHS